jgi:hypothetical protein
MNYIKLMDNSNTSPGFNSDPSSRPEWMLDHHIMLMVKAEADHDTYRQWVFYKFVVKRMLPYMDTDTQKALDTDWSSLAAREFEIKSSKSSDESKKFAIEDLHANFMEAHDAYIYLAMARAGQLELSENATLDFDKLDIKVVEKIVHMSQTGGLAAGATKASELAAEAQDATE